MNYTFLKWSALLFLSATLLTACKSESGADAMGSFESDEIIVAAQATGVLDSFGIEEGQHLEPGTQVGKIDDNNTVLQKAQAEASIQALNEKTIAIAPQIKLLEDQIAVQQSQLKSALKEQTRIQNLYAKDAATGQQLDNVNTQVDVLKKQIITTQQQINVTKSTLGTQNSSILSERVPMQKKVSIIDDQIAKSNIINPIKGTVLTKYMYRGEYATIGKPLYKIADLDNVYLKAYIDQTQLADIKIGQQVQVRIDDNEAYKYYNGTIRWINDEAEFTPKTIQTKDERENLVYAMKVSVANDGSIKIGMYGEVVLNHSEDNKDTK